MKKLFSIMLLVCAVTLGAQAQLLYKISGNGLKVPSYIIGTYHFADVKFTDSIPGLKKALDETQLVYGELRMTDMMNPDSLMKIQTAMLMPEGKKFTDLLTAEQTDRLNAFMKGLMGVDMTNPMVGPQLAPMTPQALITQFQTIMCLKNGGGFDPANGFDDYFQKQAVAAGKSVFGLETLDFQARVLFKSTSLERQTELLMCLVDNAETYNAITTDMIKAFYAQNLDEVQKVIDRKHGTTCDDTKEEQETMILGRNDNWMKLMPAIMASKPTFFAVGAAHLTGDRGLLKQLRDAGYSVEGVKE